MDRRGFLKFMGVSAAATSASTVLAGIPEVAPKIELLEPKKLITTVSDDVMLFSSVISIHMEKKENLRFLDVYSQAISPQLGRHELTGKVTVYPHPDQQFMLLRSNENIMRVAFDITELRGKLFILSTCTMDAGVGETTTAELEVVEICNNGSVKLS